MCSFWLGHFLNFFITYDTLHNGNLSRQKKTKKKKKKKKKNIPPDIIQFSLHIQGSNLTFLTAC